MIANHFVSIYFSYCLGDSEIYIRFCWKSMRLASSLFSAHRFDSSDRNPYICGLFGSTSSLYRGARSTHSKSTAISDNVLLGNTDGNQSKWMQSGLLTSRGLPPPKLGPKFNGWNFYRFEYSSKMKKVQYMKRVQAEALELLKFLFLKIQALWKRNSSKLENF